MIYEIQLNTGKIGIFEADSLTEAILDCLYIEQIQEDEITIVRMV